MRYSTQVKPISYLKARSAEVLERLSEDRRPIVITQNGEAKAVLQDVTSYEQQQEALALLKVLALGTAQIEDGRTKPVRSVIEGMKQRLKAAE
jgi:prevent-host-death family protein